MKYVITAAVLALAIAATASAAYPTKPNHLRGPICANHHTGMMRWVRSTQPCKKHEVRLLVPKTARGAEGIPGAAGAQGPQGASGAKGDQGARGPQGESGPAGATGAAGQDGAPGTSAQDGVPGSKGDTGPQGPAGSTGAQGPQGDSGPQGSAGPTGAAGQNGLGTSEVYACVNDNGASWKWGGDVDGSPDCDPGHSDRILKVVVDSTP
jgi:hypothetical protein